MKVVDRSVRKALSETYLPTASEMNTPTVQKTIYKICNNQDVSMDEI